MGRHGSRDYGQLDGEVIGCLCSSSTKVAKQYLRAEKADGSVDDVAAWELDGDVCAIRVCTVPRSWRHEVCLGDM